MPLETPLLPCLRGIACALILFTLPGRGVASDLYAVPDKGPVQRERIRQLGLDVIGRGPDGRLLVAAGVEDVQALRRLAGDVELRLPARATPDSRSKDLTGVYAGYHTYAETQALLQSLAATYPDLCELQSMGTSLEGRDLPILRITNLVAAKAPGGLPEVLILGNLHARELMSVEIPLLFAQHLLQNYGTDPNVTDLVNTRDLYIAPMTNPDGHVHVEGQTASDWWTWWRKNRRPNGDGTIGVDLNRNFSFEWGRDEFGSSSTTSSQVYRGPAPFSEPETQAIESFCANHSFVLALSYHTFGELLLYPWGYTYDFTADHELFHTLGQRLTQENGYLAGNPAEGAIYITNGDSDDWAYGETLTKNSFLCFTPELNTLDEGGFGPDDSFIAPTFAKVLPMNLRLLELAGNPRSVLGPVPPVLNPSPAFAVPTLTLDWSANDPADPNPAVQYTVEEFRDIQFGADSADSASGLWTLDGFTVSPVSFSGTGSYFSGTGDNLAQSMTTATPYPVDASSDTFTCRLRYDIEQDYDYAYLMASTDDGSTWHPVPGDVTTSADPNGSNLGHGITGSTGGAWTAAAFDLSAYLGQTIALSFRYLTDGSVQGAGFWVDELAPVPTAASRRIAGEVSGTTLALTLVDAGSYSYRVRARDAEGDSSRWSNLIRFDFDAATDAPSPVGWISHLAGNYPNPFNPRTLIDFTLGREGEGEHQVRLEIFDLSGRRVRVLVDERRPPGVYREAWEGRDDGGAEVGSGIYLARLLVDGSVTGTRKMALLR